MDQMSLFDEIIIPGQYVKTHGEIIPFEKLENMIGKEIILDHSTESCQWFKVIRLVNTFITADGINYVFYDGKSQKGSICEFFYINHGRYNGRWPTICYYVE